jgi:Uma2 family endonuclease
MSRTAVQLRPHDHGRHMTLAEFRTADTDDGHRYELSRGIITVTNIPNRLHLVVLNAARQQLAAYEVTHPGVIKFAASGTDCKIILADSESERHPDWAVYKSEMPSEIADDEDLWEVWIPDLVIEVVSPDSRHRDFEDKAEEYLQFGIPEYWVLDGERRRMLALQRAGGRYKPTEVRPGDMYRSPQLPGFVFDFGKVMEALAAAQK